MLKTRYRLLLLSFVVLGIYYPVIFAPFCSIDDSRMVDALMNQDSFNIPALFFPHSSGQYYRPLLYLSFIADKYLWGLEPSFMHFENLLLHLANTLLVFFIARSLFRSWRVEEEGWGAFLAALLFALHPINTEAVDWVSGRTDVMAGVFVLCSLLLLVWSLDACRASSRGKGAAFAVLAGGALLLGAMVKENALFLAPAAVFLALCYDRRFANGRPFRERAAAVAVPLIAVVSSAAGYLAIRSYALSGSDNGVGQALQVVKAPANYLNLIRVFAKATGFYLKKLFMPMPLNFGIVEVSGYYVIPGAIFLALLCYLAWRRSLGSFFAAAAFCICAPSFLIAVSKMSWTPVAERYLYIPCALFSMAVALWIVLLYRRTRRGGLLTGAAFLLLAGSAWATTTRNIVWQDNYTLFADTARKSPTFNAAKNDMAVALIKRGDTEQGYRILKETPSENFQVASLNQAYIAMHEEKLTKARSLLYARLAESPGYRLEILKLLIKIAQQRRESSADPKEHLALDREQLDLVSRQYAFTKDPFYRYRMGLLYLRLNDRRAAYGCFSTVKMAAPPGSYYGAAAVKLSEKFRP